MLTIEKNGVAEIGRIDENAEVFFAIMSVSESWNQLQVVYVPNLKVCHVSF